MMFLIFFCLFSAFNTQPFKKMIYLDRNQISNGNGSLMSPFKTFESIDFKLITGLFSVILINDYLFENDLKPLILENIPYNFS